MIRKKISKKHIFKSFLDYWHFARSLSRKQRQIIFNSLSSDEQQTITKSYDNGKWEDVFDRNAIDNKIEKLKKKHGFNILDIKCRALSGKSVYIPRVFWEDVLEEIDVFPCNDTSFVLGDIRATICRENKDVVLITADKTG
jgi:hypothetical protein